MPRTDMFNGMVPNNDRRAPVTLGDMDMQVLASGSWHDVSVEKTGYDYKVGYWFTVKNFMPRFWVADRGITWRRKFVGR